MFTGKKPTDDMFSDKLSLKEWVNDALQENSLSKILAPSLLAVEDQCVLLIFDLAMKCLASSPNERIDIIKVVATLQKIKAGVVNSGKATKDR